MAPWLKWIREKIAEWIWKLLMANKKENQALVKRPDPHGFAGEMDDLKTMAQKLTASELDNKELKDWSTNYRRWRQQMLTMETELWNDLARILNEQHPPSDPSVTVEEPKEDKRRGSD